MKNFFSLKRQVSSPYIIILIIRVVLTMPVHFTFLSSIRQCKLVYFILLFSHLLSHRILSEKGYLVRAFDMPYIAHIRERMIEAKYIVVCALLLVLFQRIFAEKKRKKFFLRWWWLLCLWAHLIAINIRGGREWGISKTCLIIFIESERHFFS